MALFEGGAEADRLPRRKAGGRNAGAVVKGRWGAPDVVRAFKLDERGGGKPAAPAAASKKRR